MSVDQPYLEQRLVVGEWRLGIVDDDGRWIMLRREPWPGAGLSRRADNAALPASLSRTVSPMLSPRPIAATILAGTSLIAGAIAYHAVTASRYEFTTTPQGVVRLDARSGRVAWCFAEPDPGGGHTWACGSTMREGVFVPE